MNTDFQHRVATWMQETFGPEVSADARERGFRFGEEALELLQANGTTKAEVLILVDYVFGRPVGELRQEVGGTMVTLAALCQAQGIELMTAAHEEQSRVEQPEIRAKIQRKQEAKRARMIATPLPGNPKERCRGTGTLVCHCGGDFCFCGKDGADCLGCPDCERRDDPDEDSICGNECPYNGFDECPRCGFSGPFNTTISQ